MRLPVVRWYRARWRSRGHRGQRSCSAQGRDTRRRGLFPDADSPTSPPLPPRSSQPLPPPPPPASARGVRGGHHTRDSIAPYRGTCLPPAALIAITASGCFLTGIKASVPSMRLHPTREACVTREVPAPPVAQWTEQVVSVRRARGLSVTSPL